MKVDFKYVQFSDFDLFKLWFFQEVHQNYLGNKQNMVLYWVEMFYKCSVVNKQTNKQTNWKDIP